MTTPAAILAGCGLIAFGALVGVVVTCMLVASKRAPQESSRD